MMSKFLDLIEATERESISNSDVEIMNRATDRVVNKKSNNPQDVELHKKNLELQKKRKDLVNRLKSINITEADEDEVAQSPEDGAPEAQVTTMSPEGEVFYVDMIKKALFVDLDNVELTSFERDVVTNDVTPTNAKDVANTLRKIISDYGL